MRKRSQCSPRVVRRIKMGMGEKRYGQVEPWKVSCLSFPFYFLDFFKWHILRTVSSNYEQFYFYFWDPHVEIFKTWSYVDSTSNFSLFGVVFPVYLVTVLACVCDCTCTCSCVWLYFCSLFSRVRDCTYVFVLARVCGCISTHVFTRACDCIVLARLYSQTILASYIYVTLQKCTRTYLCMCLYLHLCYFRAWMHSDQCMHTVN
jgi:hypothetical protein